eukprot:3223645-Amphidinium_carterae.1
MEGFNLCIASRNCPRWLVSGRSMQLAVKNVAELHTGWCHTTYAPLAIPVAMVGHGHRHELSMITSGSSRVQKVVRLSHEGGNLGGRQHFSSKTLLALRQLWCRLFDRCVATHKV